MKRLVIAIAVDPSDARKGFGQVETDAERMARKLNDVHTSVSKNVGRAGAAVALGVGLAIKSSISAAQESQRVSKITESVVKSTGGAANLTADQVGDMATRLSNLTGVDDELIQSSQNVLLTFTNVRNEVGKGNDIFEQASGAALDLSTVMGGDLQGATTLLGKALNDPIAGLSKLGRAGVTFTEQQKETIKGMVESGNLLGAQKVILGEVNREFGGSAAAAATDADRARVALGNMQESLGNAFLPAVESASRTVAGLANAFSGLPQGAQVAAVGLVGIGGAALFLVPKVAAAVRGLSELRAAMAAAKAASAAGSASTFAALGAVGPVAAAAAIPVGLLTATYLRNETVKRRLAGLTELYVGTLNEEAAGHEGVTRSTMAESFAKDRLNGKLLESGIAFGKIYSLIRNAPQSLGGLTDGQTILTLDALNARMKDLNFTQDQQNTLRRVFTTLNDPEEFFAWAGGVYEQGKALAESTRQQRLATEAKKSGTAAGAAADAAMAKEAESAASLGRNLSAVKTHADAASSALSAFFTGETSTLQAQIAAKEALVGVTEALRTNGNAFTENTDKGRENLTAIIAGRDAAARLAGEQNKVAGGYANAKATLDGYANSLIVMAHNAGASDDEIRDLLSKMNLLPEQIDTALTLSGAKRVGKELGETKKKADAAAAKRYLELAAKTAAADIALKRTAAFADDAARDRDGNITIDTRSAEVAAQRTSVFANDAARDRDGRISLDTRSAESSADRAADKAREAARNRRGSLGLDGSGAIATANRVSAAIDNATRLRNVQLVFYAAQSAVHQANDRDAFDKTPPGHEWGTRSASKGIKLVGESGPELVYMAGGETIVPAPKTRQMARSLSEMDVAPSAVRRAPAAVGASVAPSVANVQLDVYLDGKQIEAVVRDRAHDRVALSGRPWVPAV